MVKMRKLLIGLLLFIAVLPLGFQFWQSWSFQQQGPRFTAQNGQELCERVAELEKYSIGFRQSGIKRNPCTYSTPDK